MNFVTCLLTFLIGGIQPGTELPFFCSEPLQTSPSEELRCLFLDRRGMMWIGTNSGLRSYDGYSLHPVPTIPDEEDGPLPNNTILSITDDQDDNLWLGTRNGLVRMDRRAGGIKTFKLPAPEQEDIYTLFTAADGTIWIGTDGGLTHYDAEKESFHTYNVNNAWIVYPDGSKERLGPYSVKSIVETSEGELFIGTWSSGLLRFDPRGDTFYAFPTFNPARSAFSLMLDSRGRLWIGTWGQGLYILDNPYDDIADARIRRILPARGDTRNFTRLVEDLYGGVVWAGDIDGICLFDLEHPEAGFQVYRETSGVQQHPLRYCSDIVTDRWGNVWLGMLYDGVFHVRTQRSPFRSVQLRTPDSGHPRNSVSTLFTDDGEQLWMGLLPYGLALQERSGDRLYLNEKIPGFSSIPQDVFRASVSSIIRRSDGELWVATRGNGILALEKGRPATQLTSQNTDFLTENYINVLFHDRYGYTWVGGRTSLCLIRPDGHGGPLSIYIDGKQLSRLDVQDIMEDRDGNFWICTEGQGILHVTGHPQYPERFQFSRFSRELGNYSSNEATACLQDHVGTIWAISNGSGLSRLDRPRGRFAQVNHLFHINQERILAINEDLDNNLWLTVNNALVRLKPSEKGEATAKWYSREDGLGEIMFFPNATFRFRNELFFGSRNGYFIYDGTQEEEDGKPLRIAITDLQVDGVSVSALPPQERKAITEQSPMFTHRITIPASVKEFRMDFSLLSHMWQQQNHYAYRMEGYERSWHYLEGSHSATYQNMPPGSYHFQLRAAGPDGRWQEMTYPVAVHVLPPWWATWWAKLLSALLVIALILTAVSWYIQHLKSRQSRQMNQVLTNITHELLTPLAVISGSIEELRQQGGASDGKYSVIDNNISRITRLLRQILEVRKSDAGKLRLEVFQADLAAFVREECRNLAPMATHQRIQLLVDVPDTKIDAWFDPDKVDKILYNLISNAVKYQREEGFVEVSLRQDGAEAIVSVRDNGIGIPAARMKQLYRRYQDGDYRMTRVTGTGLGLSLTRELVKLHHGDIHCESREGVGTVFTVRIPIGAEAYPERETGTAAPSVLSERSPAVPEESPDLPSSDSGFTLLVVEDNVELLELISRRFAPHFRILKARDGLQALDLMKKEEVDIIVSDVMMPQMDGFEMTRRIKESDDYAQLPVILLTARTREEDRLQGYRIGADDFLTKPFRMEELVIRVGSIIKNRERIRKRFRSQTEIPQEKDVNVSPEARFVQQATACVLEHLTEEDYGRDALAQDMCVSSSSLYNKLRAATGENISGFINAIRLKEASRIAKAEPDISIGELSERVGYHSTRYFTMCFKKEFGVPPKEFLDQQKQSAEATHN